MGYAFVWELFLTEKTQLYPKKWTKLMFFGFRMSRGLIFSNTPPTLPLPKGTKKPWKRFMFRSRQWAVHRPHVSAHRAWAHCQSGFHLRRGKLMPSLTHRCLKVHRGPGVRLGCGFGLGCVL